MALKGQPQHQVESYPRHECEQDVEMGLDLGDEEEGVEGYDELGLTWLEGVF